MKQGRRGCRRKEASRGRGSLKAPRSRVRQTRQWSLPASASVEGQQTPWKAAKSELRIPAGIAGVSIGTSLRYNSLWALSRLDGAPSCVGSRARQRTVWERASACASRCADATVPSPGPVVVGGFGRWGRSGTIGELLGSTGPSFGRRCRVDDRLGGHRQPAALTVVAARNFGCVRRADGDARKVGSTETRGPSRRRQRRRSGTRSSPRAIRWWGGRRWPPEGQTESRS